MYNLANAVKDDTQKLEIHKGVSDIVNSDSYHHIIRKYQSIK